MTDTNINKTNRCLTFLFADAGPCLKMILLLFVTWYLNILLLGVLCSCLTDVKAWRKVRFLSFGSKRLCDFLPLTSRQKNIRLDSLFCPLYFKFCLFLNFTSK